MSSRKANLEKILVPSRVEGYWRQILHDKAGRVVDPGSWKKNLIVNKSSELIAWFLKQGGAVGGPVGIGYYALGAGLSGWDTSLPGPSVTDTVLETELVDGVGAAVSRKAPTMAYLDSAGAVTMSITGTLKLTVIYDYSELNSVSAPALNKWREFGVFAGNASGSSPDTGYLFNHVTHGLFVKTSALRVTRETVFTL